MSALLVRGLSVQDRREIQKMATAQNVSMNQWLMNVIHDELQRTKSGKEKELRQKKAFQRIRELYEIMRRKHGMQEESWKMIRRMRDERMKRYDPDYS